MTEIEVIEALNKRRVQIAFSIVCADLYLLSRDAVIALDQAVQDERVRWLREDEEKEAGKCKK